MLKELSNEDRKKMQFFRPQRQEKYKSKEMWLYEKHILDVWFLIVEVIEENAF